MLRHEIEKEIKKNNKKIGNKFKIKINWNEMLRMKLKIKFN